MTYRVQTYADIQTFAEHADPFLLKHEARNNLQLGLIRHALDDASFSFDFAATVESATGLVSGVLTRTPGRGIVLSELPPEAHETVASVLSTAIPDVSGVVGPACTAGCVASEIAKRLNVTVAPHMRHGILELRAVSHPRAVIGAFTGARAEHLPVVLEWTALFHEELPELGPPPPIGLTESRVRNKRVFLWLDGNSEPVSMAVRVRESPHGGFIGYVYTPSKHRGHGYASNCVSWTTQAILDEGKEFCGLYVDLMNPVSTRMYSGLGYNFVGESHELRFLPRTEQS